MPLLILCLTRINDAQRSWLGTKHILPIINTPPPHVRVRGQPYRGTTRAFFPSTPTTIHHHPTRPAPAAYPASGTAPYHSHGALAREARLQRWRRRVRQRQRQQRPSAGRVHGRQRQREQGSGGRAGVGRVRRGASRVRDGRDAGGRRGDGRGQADQDRGGEGRRRAAAAAGARRRKGVLLHSLRVLCGGERDGVRVLGGGAGVVPAAGRGCSRDGGRPAGAGAALLGGGRRRGVRHPRRARQRPRALGQGLQRLRPILRARDGRRHRLTARRVRKPRAPHARHTRHPQELIVLLASNPWS